MKKMEKRPKRKKEKLLYYSIIYEKAISHNTVQ